MADVIKEAQVNIKASDQTKAGAESAKRNLHKVGAAANQTQKKMAGFVSEETGRNLSQFNEKTEKGRQLLNAFGGAIGGAAGEVVYYSGTLSYVIGRFSAMELAAMGALAVVGGIAWAFTRTSVEAEKAAKFTEEYAKRNTDLNKEISDATVAIEDQVMGLDAIGKVTAKAHAQTELFRGVVAQLKQELKEFDFAENDLAGYEALEAKLTRHEKVVSDSDAAYKRALAAQGRFRNWQMDQAIKQQADRDEQQRKLKETLEAQQAKARRERDDAQLFQAMQADADRALALEARQEQARLDQRLEYAALQAAITRNATDLDSRILEDKYAREDELARQAMERETELAALRWDVAMASVELFSIVADAIGKSSRAGAAFQIAAIVAEATVQSAFQIAKGFAALANPYGGQLQAALHFLAAAKFAAVGAVKIAGVGGGGGGGSAASYGAGSQARGTTPTTSEEQAPTQNVIIYVTGHYISTKPEYERTFAEGVRNYNESQNPGQERDGF